MKKISILGSTGSIGQTTLGIIADHPNQFEIVGLAAGKNMQLLKEQIQTFAPKCVSVQDAAAQAQLHKHKLGIEILVGTQGAATIASMDEADSVVSAIVGATGLRPTLAAIQAGKDVLLANKESMVVSGALMCKAVGLSGSRLLPIDSEHSAIFQCLQGHQNQDIAHVTLTASGGPFFSQEKLNFENITVEQALNHPNWDMGPKITIDSATMMNKALEVIEAKWLFDLEPAQIKVLVHPQSIIHSIVDFKDGSSLSQMGLPDMRGPIGYALAYPNRLPHLTQAINLAQIGKLTFFPPAPARFPSIDLAFQALASSPTHPAVLNGANEACVQAFLDKAISFQKIFSILDQTLSAYSGSHPSTIEDTIEANSWGFHRAQQVIEKHSNSTYT